MSEPTFEQLHPGAASTLSTGVDIASVVSIDLAKQSMLDDGMSGGSGADVVAFLPSPEATATQSAFQIELVDSETDEDGQSVYADFSVKNRYYNLGGIMKFADGNEGVIVYVFPSYLVAKFTADNDGQFVYSGIEVYETFSELQSEQNQMGCYLVALYRVDAADSIVDLRTAPQIQTFEGVLS